MILADVATKSDAVTLWQIIQIASFLIGPICSILVVVIMRSDKKQKREISFEVEMVSKQEFKEHVLHNTKRHGELFDGIDVSKDESTKAVAESARILEEKIDENYKELTEKLRTLPNEIVTMLKNTKGLI